MECSIRLLLALYCKGLFGDVRARFRPGLDRENYDMNISPNQSGKRK